MNVSKGGTYSKGVPLRRRIAVRIILLIVIAIAATAQLCVAITRNTMEKIIETASMSDANASVNILVNEVEALREKSQLIVASLSYNADVIDAVANTNTSALASVARGITNDTDVDDLLVTDLTGTVIYSAGNANKSGASIKERDNISRALRGEMYAGILTGSDYRYAVVSSSPVYKNGTLIGTVTAVYTLENTALVDDLKDKTGNEYTIFVGDERLNTTIIKDGGRVVGTKLNESIARLVVGEKTKYLGNADILGTKHATAYVPVLSEDGTTVTGILFSGVNLSGTIAAEKQAQLISLSAGIVLIVIFSAIALVFIKSRVSTPLRKVVTGAQAIAAGTMDQATMLLLGEIKSKDEIGLVAKAMEQAMASIDSVIRDAEVLNNAAANFDLTVQSAVHRHDGKYKEVMLLADGLFKQLGSVIRQIYRAAGQTHDNAALISEGSMSLAQGAAEQAAAIEEMTATVGQFKVRAYENADIADQANGAMIKVQKEAEQGSEKMKKLRAALDAIDRTSSDISVIIKTIEDIAFQTNILALNAAVEAARAGVNGKGFAVVAAEVKNLAQKSAEAAQKTNQLIGTNADVSREGAAIGLDAHEALGKIVASINEAAGAISKIAWQSRDQANTAEQLNIGLEQISQVVRNNTATAEESASSSQEMANQAQNLNALVTKYRID